MDAMSTRELDSITRAREEAGEENPELGEIFDDFASQEFIKKNIRVRPVSGQTHNADDADGRNSNVSIGKDGDD